MKTLDIAFPPPGTIATMKTKPNDDVSSYVVFVRKWTPTGPVPAATFHFNQLEAAGGASITFGNDLGYDFILQALVRPQSHAAINVSLQLQPPGGGDGYLFDKPVTLPNSEGPVVEREWKYIIP